MCAQPRTPIERAQHQAGGGADLRVRSAGFGSGENRSLGQPSRIYCSTFSCSTLSAPGRADLRVRSAALGSAENRSPGQPKNPDRKSQCVPHREHPSKGAGTRAAGGRTSVSAPLDWDRQRIVPLGSQAGSTALLSPVPLSRPPAARTSVSAPLDWVRQRIAPMGSQKTRIGNTCVPTKNTIRPSHVLKGHS